MSGLLLIITATNTKFSSNDRYSSSSAVTGQYVHLHERPRCSANLSTEQLVLDLLSVHLIRNKEDTTIISYHPNMPHHPITKAKYLRDRIRYAGQSVYWQMIFQKSPDPTFVLLTFVWHTLYAWDEALEHLYGHICWLVSPPP